MIRLLEGGRYLTAPESRAFLGWTAEEIHTAMSEPELSAATSEVLTRVGRALGALGGTNPDHMPWLRAQRREARAEARASTLAAGAGGLLASRGMPGLESPLEPHELTGVTDEEVVDALRPTLAGPCSSAFLRQAVEHTLATCPIFRRHLSPVAPFPPARQPQEKRRGF